MRDLLHWSLNLGRFGGVQARLHVFFFAAAAYALHLAGLYEFGQLLGLALAAMGILLASVILHELGHCLAARRLGGEVDQVVFWPLGGLTSPRMRSDPVSEVLVALSGPAVSLLVCGLFATALQGLDVRFEQLLNPLVPPITSGDGWQAALEMGFWLNWVLAVMNLLPALPLDGGRALAAGLGMVMDRRVANYAAARCGQVVAVGVCLAAWWVHGGEYNAATMPLALLGLFLFCAAQSEVDRSWESEADEHLFGYDFSQGYSSLERSTVEESPQRPGFLRQWIDSCRDSRRRRRIEQEVAEERRVDGILARLHETGMDGLSPQDQALLLRVSQRYRNRLGQ
jgi:stage IV sporulation protein FB